MPGRLPRAHWRLLLVCLVLLAELCVSGYVNRAAGEGPRQPAVDGPDPALPAGSGPVLRIVAEGHEVGANTFTHPDLGTTPAGRQRLEVMLTADAIAGGTGRTVWLLRPPYSETPAAITTGEFVAMRTVAAMDYLIALVGARQRWAPIARSGLEKSSVGEAVVTGR